VGFLSLLTDRIGVVGDGVYSRDRPGDGAHAWI
jgi:hypothetical protein